MWVGYKECLYFFNLRNFATKTILFIPTKQAKLNGMRFPGMNKVQDCIIIKRLDIWQHEICLFHTLMNTYVVEAKPQVQKNIRHTTLFFIVTFLFTKKSLKRKLSRLFQVCKMFVINANFCNPYNILWCCRHAKSFNLAYIMKFSD